jgi:hypothetical protein
MLKANPPLLERAAQITSPFPFEVQLGADVMVPARVFQPAHAVPLN